MNASERVEQLESELRQLRINAKVVRKLLSDQVDSLNEARTLARIFYTTAPVEDSDREITYERYPWLDPDGPD